MFLGSFFCFFLLKCDLVLPLIRICVVVVLLQIAQHIHTHLAEGTVFRPLLHIHTIKPIVSQTDEFLNLLLVEVVECHLHNAGCEGQCGVSLGHQLPETRRSHLTQFLKDFKIEVMEHCVIDVGGRGTDCGSQRRRHCGRKGLLVRRKGLLVQRKGMLLVGHTLPPTGFEGRQFFPPTVRMSSVLMETTGHSNGHPHSLITVPLGLMAFGKN